MKVRFLIDENLPPRLKVAVHHLSTEIDILRVGDPEAPGLGTKDPDILRYLELAQRLLVTDNRVSMPEHLETYWRNNGHIWGLLWVKPATPIGRLAQDLHLLWAASEAEEWLDRLEWIPF